MTGPLLGILGKAVGGMLASQVGSGLGALASEVLSVSDIGLPLAAPGQAAIVTTNVAAFADRPRRERGRRAPLPRAARGRPPAAASPTSRGCATT